MGYLVLLDHRLFEGSVSSDLGSKRRNTHPQGWRVFPCRHRTPVPALHMREMPLPSLQVAMPWGPLKTVTTWDMIVTVLQIVGGLLGPDGAALKSSAAAAVFREKTLMNHFL